MKALFVTALYNFTLLLCLPLLLVHYLKGKIYLRKYTRPIRERLGFNDVPLIKNQSRILVHAVSVGESVAAQPLVNLLSTKFPKAKIIVSNVTETGHKRAKESLNAEHFVFFPLDYINCVQRFIRRVQPDLVIILETEIWPNFLQECQKNQISVVFVNGRISDRSFSRYRPFRFALSHYLKPFLFCMQSTSDQKKVKELGALHTVITPNLKFDQLKLNLENPKRLELTEYFKEIDQPLICFGSTHQLETKWCLEIISDWVRSGLNARFIIAPRHLNFLSQYLKLAENLNLSYRQKSISEFDSGSVLFLDTYGELALCYEHCEIVFVGGSLEPIGGHSILEPALFSKAILYGPNMQNNQEICEEFETTGASLRVQDKVEMRSKIEYLLENETFRNELGKNAMNLLNSKMGASKKIIETIQEHFPDISARLTRG